MSLFHYLHIGHFDEQALRQHQLVIQRPLDMELAGKIFHELGGTNTEDGRAFLGDEEIYTEPGNACLVCQIPRRYSKAVEFIYRLAKQTGCVVATVEGGGSETAEQFLSSYQKREQRRPPAAQLT